MQLLLDGDIVHYEVGFSSQKTNELGELEVSSWEWVQELLDRRIALIQDEVEATKSPIIFLTNSKLLNKRLNKQREWEGSLPKPFVENFRVGAAEEKVYKGTRKAEKPFHHENILAYLLANYECRVHEGGLEADDYLCITQYARWKQGFKDTILASRDKDLRQCPGLHYSWEIGKQASIGPFEVTELGHLEHTNEGERDAKNKLKPAKIFGTGDKFFYYQLINGDAVDNIGGIKGKGPVFGYNLLKDATTSRECYELVKAKYEQAWREDWKEKMIEQAKLLWMVRELNEDGSFVHWTPPKR